MYRVTYTKHAERSLLRMPHNLALRLREKLAQIASSPYGLHNNVSKLQNRDGYRLRVGDWRVIYEIHDGELIILVLKIAPRGNVYR